MRFDYAVGNPPFFDMEESKIKPIYNHLMENSYRVSDTAILITPARFLFNTGKTSKKWNQKMLEDPHLRVLLYDAKAANVFQDIDMNGGIVITERNLKETYSPITVFTPYSQLNGIIEKVTAKTPAGSFLDSIVSNRAEYRVSPAFYEDFPFAPERVGKKNSTIVSSNFFEAIPECIAPDPADSSHAECIALHGRAGYKRRSLHYINRKYIQDNPFTDAYNVALPKANGRGRFGEILAKTEILEPGVGTTDTFISIGMFHTAVEAENLQKYIKTKFFRALLGAKKVTQDNPRAVFTLIPIQDFTSESDIDWTVGISVIDEQLYMRYGLSEAEKAFVISAIDSMI